MLRWWRRKRCQHEKAPVCGVCPTVTLTSSGNSAKLLWVKCSGCGKKLYTAGEQTPNYTIYWKGSEGGTIGT